MSAALEQQYRRALRWYPKNWRRRNEDAVVGTLLDAAEEAGRLVPARGELADLRIHGLLSRFGFVGRILPPAIRDRVSAIALGTGAAISLWGIAYSVTNANATGALYRYLGIGSRVTFGPFTSLDVILYSVWIAAFVASLVGAPRLTRILLVTTIPAAIVSAVLSVQFGMVIYPSLTFVLLLEAFALLGVLGKPRMKLRWRLWVAISAAVATGFVAYVLLASHVGLPNVTSNYIFELQFLFGWQPFVGWICAGAPVIAIVCLALRRWAWGAVVTISFLPWLALYVYEMAARGSISDFLLLALVAVAVALASITTVISLATLGLRLTVTRSR
jgi:hypothetical protein